MKKTVFLYYLYPLLQLRVETHNKLIIINPNEVTSSVLSIIRHFCVLQTKVQLNSTVTNLKQVVQRSNATFSIMVFPRMLLRCCEL